MLHRSGKSILAAEFSLPGYWPSALSKWAKTAKILRQRLYQNRSTSGWRPQARISVISLHSTVGNTDLAELCFLNLN